MSDERRTLEGCISMVEGIELTDDEAASVATDLRHYAAELAELRAANSRLAAVVERLPKTADGVPIVPGMAGVHVTETETVDVILEAVGVYHDPTLIDAYCKQDGDYREVHSYDCYSTREAAEAAKGGE